MSGDGDDDDDGVVTQTLARKDDVIGERVGASERERESSSPVKRRHLYLLK